MYSRVLPLTEVEGESKSASKLMNPLGATEMPKTLTPSPLPALAPLILSAIASAIVTAPPAPPVPSQPLLRAAEAILSATALQNPPPTARDLLFRMGLTFGWRASHRYRPSNAAEVQGEVESQTTGTRRTDTGKGEGFQAEGVTDKQNYCTVV